MRWYGSLQNRLEENCKGRKPEIGMGATEMFYSDRQAWEVVGVKDERHITVRRMKAKCNNYHAGDWSVEPDVNGRTVQLFLTKKGQWREKYPSGSLGNVFVLGYAEEYEDPTF